MRSYNVAFVAMMMAPLNDVSLVMLRCPWHQIILAAGLSVVVLGNSKSPSHPPTPIYGRVGCRSPVYNLHLQIAGLMYHKVDIYVHPIYPNNKRFSTGHTVAFFATLHRFTFRPACLLYCTQAIWHRHYQCHIFTCLWPLPWFILTQIYYFPFAGPRTMW